MQFDLSRCISYGYKDRLRTKPSEYADEEIWHSPEIYDRKYAKHRHEDENSTQYSFAVSYFFLEVAWREIFDRFEHRSTPYENYRWIIS